MLVLQEFNEGDIQRIKEFPKSIRFTVILMLAIFFPLSFFFGLTGLLQKGYGYWVTTISFLIFFSCIVFFYWFKNYLNYKRDFSKCVKYSGLIVVKYKSVKKGEVFIFTDSLDVKKISIYPTEQFSKIMIGDLLFIEVSKYTTTILRLEKDGESLL